MQSKRFLVMGAGSWGTALAIHLANNGQPVSLWAHHGEQIQAMQEHRENSRYLPGIRLPNTLTPVSDLAEACHTADFILVAVPSHAFLETLIRIKPYWSDRSNLIFATKGLEPQSGRFLHVTAQQVLGPVNLAMLTGPSFAKEVAKGLPTAVVLAAQDLNYARMLQTYFHTPYFRTYLCPDLIGAEIGGAVKNILAIAVGIADGLEYGTNTRAALMTRGLSEMVRLGLALGAHKETFMGLSGLGDLILTCTDNQSRNRRFGLCLGQGKSAETAYQEIGQVVEGVQTTETIHRLVTQLQLDLPIIEQMYQVLHQGLGAKQAVKNLLARSAGIESV